MKQETVNSAAEKHASCLRDGNMKSTDMAAFIDGARWTVAEIYNRMNGDKRDLCEVGSELFYELESYLYGNE